MNSPTHQFRAPIHGRAVRGPEFHRAGLVQRVLGLRAIQERHHPVCGSLASRGTHAFAVHAGRISTNLQCYTKQMIGDEFMEKFDEASRRVTGMSLADARELDPYKTLQQGCGTTLRAALDPNLVKEGVYMNDTLLTTDPKWVKAWATNPDFAERLWTMSEELVGEKFVF